MKLLRYALPIMWFFLTPLSEADQFPDDHADAAAGATGVTFENQAGIIDMDTDRDWFALPVHAGRQYRISVVPGSLKDATLRMRTGDGTPIISTAHSVGAAQASLLFPHGAGPTTVYLEVGGFARYTTGSYTLNVSDQAVVDIDADGMADTWEIAFFTNLTQVAEGDVDADGLSNRDEYELGYDPLDSASRFALTGLVVDELPRVVTWVSAPYRTYDVQASPSVTGTNWVTLGSVPGTSDEASFADPSGSAEPWRFWRIRVR